MSVFPDGHRLGRYLLSSVLATGSMGTLYKGVDPASGQPVAIKTVRRDRLDTADDDFTARLRAEAQAAGRLTHPGIVAVYDYGEEQAHAFIVMEYVDGQTLQQRIGQAGALPVPTSVHIMSQLLDALQFAHEHGVWHRDVNPANILLTSADQVKVIDFGIGQVAPSGAAQPEPIMGTAGYVAPETYLTDTFDHRIDVFAAGVVFYQMLTGVPPFAGTAETLMFKVCHETPAPPSVIAGSALIRRLDPVVLKALARQPEDRFASAAAFRQAMLQALD